jgi:pimeloyl-ACP methyl ester carboxylesterase
MTFLYAIILIASLYACLSFFLVYLVHRIPREPVVEPPDWGSVIDTTIPSSDGGFLEVWRVEPEGKSRGVVILAHGWSRNRDRMTGRARIFGKMGFTTVMHSARDHGGSSKSRIMNAARFGQDIETVLDWVKEPALLYGHSAGAAGAVIAAAANRERIRALFLEGCYPYTKEALRSLYRSYNKFLGMIFVPTVVFLMDIFYCFRLDEVSPASLAADLEFPVMIIHGENDKSFPAGYAKRLAKSFLKVKPELLICPGADHSGSSLYPGYETALRSFLDRNFPAE